MVLTREELYGKAIQMLGKPSHIMTATSSNIHCMLADEEGVYRAGIVFSDEEPREVTRKEYLTMYREVYASADYVITVYQWKGTNMAMMAITKPGPGAMDLVEYLEESLFADTAKFDECPEAWMYAYGKKEKWEKAKAKEALRR